MADGETDDDIGRLYAVRPADFVKERSAVATALKVAGRRDEAAAIEKLPRPTSSVWAVNQLARQEPDLVQRLVGATARLQGGGHDSYADALGEHRDVLRALRAKAEELLEASALRPTPELLTRVVHDLRAGILNPESRPLIERGRLVRDVADEGATNPFEQELPAVRPGSGDRPPAPREEPRARQEARARDEARAFRERRLKNLRERVAAAEAASERDERDVATARRALSEAEGRRETSRTALAQASAELQAAEAEPES